MTHADRATGPYTELTTHDAGESLRRFIERYGRDNAIYAARIRVHRGAYHAVDAVVTCMTHSALVAW